MPSMAKVNNRVINYRDFSFSLRNNFINEYLVLLLSFWREILSRNNDSWTRDRSLTRITLSQMGKKAGNSNVDPATWPNKMEKENNGGLTSDLYLQNNAVSFFFFFFFFVSLFFLSVNEGTKASMFDFFFDPSKLMSIFHPLPSSSRFLWRAFIFCATRNNREMGLQRFQSPCIYLFDCCFLFSCIRRILSSNFPQILRSDKFT